MVSTRHHPRAFPEPASPTPRSPKSTEAKSRSASTSYSPPASPTSPTTPSPSTLDATSNDIVAKPRASRKRRSTAAIIEQSYTHSIDPLTIVWLFISLPLVFWDTGYVLLRPHSMPGGRLHSPIWYPYALYGTVDYMYGWPAWNDGVGFTAAQGSLNLVESLMYCYYLYVLADRGKETGWYEVWNKNFYTKRMVVSGEGVALAVVIAFAGAVVTFSKTALYWLNEYFANFENIGHNSASRLFFLWIIPNGAWLLLPGYMIFVLGKEIIRAMHLAGTSGLEKED